MADIETPNMDLSLPEPATEPGPSWAEKLNAALERVDAHDHSEGEGVKVTPAGININADLEFNDHKATEVGGVILTVRNSNPLGAANNNQVFDKDGNLWFRDGNGDLWQLTPNTLQATFPTDLDDVIRRRARALVGWENFSYWSDNFLMTPGLPGSPWRVLHYPTNPDYPAGWLPGGVWRMVSNAFYQVAVISSDNSYPATPAPGEQSFIGDVDNDDLCYLFVRFLISSVDSTQEPFEWNNTTMGLILGFVDPRTLSCAGVGIGFGEDYIGAVAGNVASPGALAGVATTVPIALDTWFDAEFFRRRGSDDVVRWYVKVNNSEAVEVSIVGEGFHRGTPIMEIQCNGVPQGQVLVDHFAVGAQSNRPPIAPYPSPPED